MGWVRNIVRTYPVIVSLSGLTAGFAVTQPGPFIHPFNLLVGFFAAAVVLAPICLAVDVYHIRNSGSSESGGGEGVETSSAG